jgi:hypothetical protein
MTTYLVRARPRIKLLADLQKRLESNEILQMRPFGNALHNSLQNAKIDSKEEFAYWVEEDYCSPPLAKERELLDQYFDDIQVEMLDETRLGWERINDKPSMWKAKEGNKR